MTNKEALEILKTEWDINAEIFDTNFHEALNLAIKALEGNSQGEEWLDNFINKYNESRDFRITDIRDREKLLDELRPKSEWVELGDGSIVCPICKTGTSIKSIPSVIFFRYCPYCGADMRKGGDEE